MFTLEVWATKWVDVRELRGSSKPLQSLRYPLDETESKREPAVETCQ